MKTFLRYCCWPLCKGNPPVIIGRFPHRGHWRGAWVFSLICALTSVWANNQDAGGVRRNGAHYDVIAIALTVSAWSVHPRTWLHYLTGPSRHLLWLCHWPLTRYVKLRVAYAPAMPRRFSPPPTLKETASYRSRDASRHVRHPRAVMHVGIAN